MTSGMNTIIYPVKDLTQAKALYGRLLGVEPVIDQPYYVQFDVGDQKVGLDPNGHKQGLTHPVGYWHVDDLKSTLQSLLDSGAQPQQEVKDVGGGMLIASVRDADNYLRTAAYLAEHTPARTRRSAFERLFDQAA